MSISEERKKAGLLNVYAENIRTAFAAEKETGEYVNCEFAVNLEHGEVFHSLSAIKGTDVVIIQKDRFPYDEKFKKTFMSEAFGNFVESGVVTAVATHNHRLDTNPSNSATLKSVSSANNIVNVKNAEVDYIERIAGIMERKKAEANGVSLTPTTNGWASALVLAFLVGFFDGGLLMLLLKFFIK